MRSFLFAAALGLGALAFAGPGDAQAHDPRGYRPNHSSFGNGRHDLTPHWHQTQTPYGSYYWYGNGLHDYLPHQHSVSPWSGIRSYSITPFGPTTSYNGFPGYGGYRGYGGYYPYRR